MRNNSINKLAALGSVMTIGIFFVQLFWLNKAFDVHEKLFSQSVHVVLHSIAEKLGIATAHKPTTSAIKKLSANYYIMEVSGTIDTNLLNTYLKQEFAARGMQAKLDYGIYKDTGNLAFATTINTISNRSVSNGRTLKPVFRGRYTIGVSFPHKDFTIAGEMYIWIFSTAVLILFIGFFTYAIFIVLKQKEYAALQKGFVNNMTHEFKTPLSTISLAAQTLVEHTSVSNCSEAAIFARILVEESGRLDNHVEKILQMASSECNAITLNRETIDVHNLLKELVQMEECRTKNICLTLQLNAERILINADKVHLKNVLHNLIDNAIKYSYPNSQIIISTSDKDGQFIISVKDEGVGIKSKFHAKIGEAFFRVPTGDVHNVKGFGLGINYVRKIARAQGWKFDFKSQENLGSVFYLVLS